MRTIRRGLWQFLALGLIVLLLLNVFADFGAVLSALRSLNWWVFPIVVGLTLMNQLFRFVKWEYLLRKVEVRLAPRTSARIFGSGLIMIMTPGKFGEVWKSWLIEDVQGTPKSETMPVILVERLTDLIAVVLISFLGVLAFGYSATILLLLTVPFSIGIGLLHYDPASLWLFDQLERISFLEERINPIRNVYDSSRTLLRGRPLIVTTVLSVISWGFECVGMWLVLYGFEANISLLVAAFIFTFSSILGALSMLPGGLGVTEGTMSGLLLAFGTSRSIAASTTIVVRAATLWFVAGLASLIYVTSQWQQSVDLN